MSRSNNRKRSIDAKYKRWEKNPRCEYCGVVTKKQEGFKLVDNTFTKDHVFVKGDPKRENPPKHCKRPWFVSCFRCNNDRGCLGFHKWINSCYRGRLMTAEYAIHILSEAGFRATLEEMKSNELCQPPKMPPFVQTDFSPAMSLTVLQEPVTDGQKSKPKSCSRFATTFLALRNFIMGTA